MTSKDAPSNSDQKKAQRKKAASLNLAQKTKKKTNWTLYLSIGFGVVAVITILIIIASQPRQGTLGYGVCKVLLNLNVPFPKTVNISAVRETGKLARIQYTHTDAFGQYQLSRIECQYVLDQDRANRKWLKALISRQGVTLQQVASAGGVSPEILLEYINENQSRLPGSGVMNRIASATGQKPPSPELTLGRATIDARPIPEDQIRLFRESIPAILRNPPDLSYPGRVPVNIRDYK